MIGQKMSQMVVDVTKTWCRKQKAAERQWRQQVAYYNRLSYSLKEAAYEAMEEAYLKASGGGKLPANARQIMYAARGKILELTGNDSLDSQYFTQTLLPNFLSENPELTADWQVAYDARGNFMEPHAPHSSTVRLGTLEVDAYLKRVDRFSPGERDRVLLDMGGHFPTAGPENRFGAILFVEKEGFWPLLEAAKIAQRYDLALMSTKGQSNVASRELVDELCGNYKIPLLVLHDFDVAGMNIRAVLEQDNRRYAWENEVEVIDLGIRLADVEACGLESEPVKSKKQYRTQLQRYCATQEEVDFLCSGKRVELNAFTSDSFVAWLEQKLQAQGVEKVMPPKGTLAEAFRRSLSHQFVSEGMVQVEQTAAEKAAQFTIPGNLEEKVRARLVETPAQPWDQIVAELASEEAGHAQ